MTPTSWACRCAHPAYHHDQHGCTNFLCNCTMGWGLADCTCSCAAEVHTQYGCTQCGCTAPGWDE